MWRNKFKVFFKCVAWNQKHGKLVVSHLTTVPNCTIKHHCLINTCIYKYTYAYTYTLIVNTYIVTSSNYVCRERAAFKIFNFFNKSYLNYVFCNNENQFILIYQCTKNEVFHLGLLEEIPIGKLQFFVQRIGLV